MYWQSAVPNASEIDSSAAHLLDALERVRPLGKSPMSPSGLGRWLLESGQDGTIADDTVVWLHRLLVPTPEVPLATEIQTTGLFDCGPRFAMLPLAN